VLNGSDPASVDAKISEPKALELAQANLDKILSQAGEKSVEREAVEGVLNVVCLLFKRVLDTCKGEADVARLAQGLLGKLAEDTQNANLRLKTMASIYNLLAGKAGVRFTTLLAMINYASSAGKAELVQVLPKAEALDGIMSEWEADAVKIRQLYTALYEAAGKHGMGKEAHALRIKFLKTLQGQKCDAAALEQASLAVGEAIANPTVFQFDEYLELDAIKALKADASHAPVYALLDLFSKDDLAAFNAFSTSNAAVLSKLKLDKDACVLKMRLLSLCSLASRQDSISYADIAACLQVKEDEVEMWGIKAMQAKLMDAKLDQLTRRLIINHCPARLFSQSQWAGMRGKLVGWRDRMQQLQQVIHATRARHAQELAMMQAQMPMQ